MIKIFTLKSFNMTTNSSFNLNLEQSTIIKLFKHHFQYFADIDT